MSTINLVFEKLKSSKSPVARVLHNNSSFNALILGFKSGMILTEHKAKWPSKLTVLQGKVRYIEGEMVNTISAYDEQEIPPDIIHEVHADEDSLCLLTQSKPN